MQLGLGQSVDALISIEDWPALQALAMEQGLYAIVLDGIEKLPASARPPQEFLLEWIGMVMQDEERYAVQQKAARKMADLFSKNYIRTYVLKGEVVAECYPKPEHRVSSDMDCFLLSVKGQFDAWALGNNLVKAQGYKVSTGFYKNSTFFYPDLSVENHQYMVPFRGNERLKELEKLLQSQLKVLALRGCSGDKSEDSLAFKDSLKVDSLIVRLREFLENEARSCSMDPACVTPEYVYRMWGGKVALDDIAKALDEAKALLR